MEDFLDYHTPINDTYNQTYDLVALDRLVRGKLNREDELLPILRREKFEAEYELQRARNAVSFQIAMKKISRINEMIGYIERKERTKLYQADVKDILQEYQTFARTSTYVDLSKGQTIEDPHLENKQRLIERYLQIAKRYYPLEIYRRREYRVGVCKNCGCELTRIANTEGLIVCEQCGAEHVTTTASRLTGEGKPPVVSSDESKDNFIRALTRYEGLQSDRPPDELYHDLDEYFLKCNRPSGEQIKLLPLNKDGTRGDTDHEMLWAALSKTGWSKYYEDSNLIANIYWGWTLPRVQNRDLILDHYDKTQAVFHRIPVEERERVSSLGTQFRLFKHLELAGHQCTMRQFKIAENSNSLRVHERLWRRMCEGTGDPEIRYNS